MKSNEVKVSKRYMKLSKSVNVIITLPNGKICDLSFGQSGEFIMIHHTTTINKICLRPISDETSIVTETNEKGSVMNLTFSVEREKKVEGES